MLYGRNSSHCISLLYLIVSHCISLVLTVQVIIEVNHSLLYVKKNVDTRFNILNTKKKITIREISNLGKRLFENFDSYFKNTIVSIYLVHTLSII